MLTIVGSVDIEKARQFLVRKVEARKKLSTAQLARARRDFQAIALLAIQKYHPKRIWQWGSLVDGDGFSEISDIDIAFEGFDSIESLFAFYGEAMRLTNFPLDVVRLEKIEPEFRELIVTQGRVVHERT